MAPQSDDPFLMLVTLSHKDFSEDILLVNNSEDVVSRGKTFIGFPMLIGLPIDDNESERKVTIQFDNASLQLIEAIRSVATQIDVKIEAILASKPDVVEIEIGELKLRNAGYDTTSITGNLNYDDFLNTALTSEKYEPANFKGLFS